MLAIKGSWGDKSATAFLILRWTFPAKRACVATDTEPDRLAAVFGDKGSQLKQARRRSSRNGAETSSKKLPVSIFAATQVATHPSISSSDDQDMRGRLAAHSGCTKSSTTGSGPLPAKLASAGLQTSIRMMR